MDGTSTKSRVVIRAGSWRSEIERFEGGERKLRLSWTFSLEILIHDLAMERGFRSDQFLELFGYDADDVLFLSYSFYI